MGPQQALSCPVPGGPGAAAEEARSWSTDPIRGDAMLAVHSPVCITHRLLRERAEGSVAIPLGADSALSRSLLLTGSQRGREGNHLFHLEAEEENL